MERSFCLLVLPVLVYEFYSPPVYLLFRKNSRLPSGRDPGHHRFDSLCNFFDLSDIGSLDGHFLTELVSAMKGIVSYAHIILSVADKLCVCVCNRNN